MSLKSQLDMQRMYSAQAKAPAEKPADHPPIADQVLKMGKKDVRALLDAHGMTTEDVPESASLSQMRAALKDVMMVDL